MVMHGHAFVSLVLPQLGFFLRNVFSCVQVDLCLNHMYSLKMTDPLLDYSIPNTPDLKLLRPVPAQTALYPRFRYMGSKHRLLEWLHSILQQLDFKSATDAFSGSGSVSYLFKSMGKEVHANDSLCFPSVLSKALIENNTTRLSSVDTDMLLASRATKPEEFFVRDTFRNIFYTQNDLEFIDDFWVGIRQMPSPNKRALALAALLRACIKRQPRGVFTISGKGSAYQDGRRDLQLSIREHFLEQVDCYNHAVFSNGCRNSASHGSVFELSRQNVDLVYMDPPYVPRSDDNCYMKRYHFLEGVSCYWEGQTIMETSKVKKITKPYTPFGHRKDAVDAFDRLFRHFADSTQVLSYSSNAYPDLETLVKLMKRYKKSVEALSKTHRYHFGTHATAKRNVVEEYLIIGQS